jgi:hypothetical protein
MRPRVALVRGEMVLDGPDHTGKDTINMRRLALDVGPERSKDTIGA